MNVCELAAIITVCAFGSTVILWLDCRRNQRQALKWHEEAEIMYYKAREIREQIDILRMAPEDFEP